MIAHISPASFNFEESRNTLTYADRAKNIRTKVCLMIFQSSELPNMDAEGSWEIHEDDVKSEILIDSCIASNEYIAWSLIHG